jgi:hypothetical protein
MRTALDAAACARSMVGTLWPYILGGGNHRGPTKVKKADGTLSPLGYDCWGFAWSCCYDEPRTVEGFNVGPWASVTGAINCDSAIEEAEHIGKTFQVGEVAREGDLFVMPSIRGPDGRRIRIGHVWICSGVPAERPAPGSYADYDTVQCQASTRPAIKRGPGPKGDGRTFKGLVDEAWRIRVLRVVG